MTSASEGVKKIFAEVGRTYDVVNRVLTLGLDMTWRRRTARLALGGGGGRWLDVCSGTGDMALLLSRVASSGASVTAVDFSLPMLRHAGRKALRRPFARVCGALPNLPFPDATFDLLTISFATRNIHLNRPALEACFGECLRILRPGGRLINLETSQPPNRLIRHFFHLYIRTVVKPLGRMISGSRSGYAYLASTIPRFYEAPQLAAILTGTGFRNVSYRQLAFGIAAVHAGQKEKCDGGAFVI